MSIKAAGLAPGERRFNGVQTTGREYRNLSPPSFPVRCTDNVSVVMRDGTTRPTHTTAGSLRTGATSRELPLAGQGLLPLKLRALLDFAAPPLRKRLQTTQASLETAR